MFPTPYIGQVPVKILIMNILNIVQLIGVSKSGFELQEKVDSQQNFVLLVLQLYIGQV